MFKIRLLHNKDIIITAAAILGFILLVLVNCLILLPMLFAVYRTNNALPNTMPVDEEIVNKALDALNQSN